MGGCTIQWERDTGCYLGRKGKNLLKGVYSCGWAEGKWRWSVRVSQWEVKTEHNSWPSALQIQVCCVMSPIGTTWHV